MISTSGLRIPKPERILPMTISRREPRQTPPTNREYNRASNKNFIDWQEVKTPGGRVLWWKLTIAFTILSLFGVAIIIVSSVFLHQAFQMHLIGQSAQFTWCLIGIVMGLILVVLSIVLSHLLISPKWRKNQQPVYPCTVRFVRRHEQTTRSPEIESTRNDINRESPPTYEDALVYFVPASEVTAVDPPSYDAQIPPYYQLHSLHTISNPELSNATPTDSLHQTAPPLYKP